MTAIITDPLKTRLAQLMLDEVNDTTDSAQYYIGIGKSDQYSAADDNIINPVQTLQEEREFRNNLQSIIKVGAASLVIPRFNWSAGSTYSAFVDSVVGIPTNSYYVITEDNHVYICLKAGTGSSTVQPDYNDNTQNPGQNKVSIFETSDGYRWKYLYELSAADTSSFLSASFIPVKRVLGTPGGAAEQDQQDVQTAAVDGAIIGFAIDSGGEGYSSAPTVTVIGDGSGAIAATPTITAGSVTALSINSVTSGGSGYSFADVSLTGSPDKPAKIRPVIAPVGGIGFDARQDLKAKSVMFNAKPTGTNVDTFIINEDFRQIGLIRSMERADSGGGGGFVISSASEKALRILPIDSADIGKIQAGDELSIGSGATLAKCFVDEVNAPLSRIFVHQNSRTGFNSFPSTGTLTGGFGGPAGIRAAEEKSNADPHTGQLLYIENRAAISRTSTQTEDIKIVITM